MLCNWASKACGVSDATDQTSFEAWSFILSNLTFFKEWGIGMKLAGSEIVSYEKRFARGQQPRLEPKPFVVMNNAANDASAVVAVFDRSERKSDPTASYKQTYRPPNGASKEINTGFGNQGKDIFDLWQNSLSDEQSSFLESIKPLISDLAPDSDLKSEEKIGQRVEQWLAEMRLSLQNQSVKLPMGLQKVLSKKGDGILAQLQEKLWMLLEQLRSDGAPIPPSNVPLPDAPPTDVPLPTVPSGIRDELQTPYFSPNQLFSTQDSSFKIGIGDNTATIQLKGETSTVKSSTYFYVEDALGQRKGVSIEFSNSRLNEEFSRYFKQSPIYGKTVSLEKFNRFLERFKDRMKDLENIDLSRLQSKLHGEETKSLFTEAMKALLKLIGFMRK